jgi:tRNA A-37 threonylcarbamoyl transferase component Bud32
VATVSPDSQARTEAAEVGTHLKYFGDYELLEEIARGGMGIVWKARQTSLQRDVAIKMIRNGALAGTEEVARFMREAQAAANLQHPNIVAIHEVGEHGGQHYYSMDYVAGRNLAALVQDGPLPPQRAARYVKTIAGAVHFAHQRGTLHRDLKPLNVLIDADDQPRVTDFGLAKLMKGDSGMTQSGVPMGSPSYMPPEQAAGRLADVGPASDVYGLGAMLYELITGRPPFRRSTPMATLVDVLEAEPTAPRRLKAEIPVDLETICLKCLEKSPSARYPTARALAEELDRFLKGEPIQARPASPVRKVVSWSRQHLGTLAALAALAVVALAFGVFYLIEENAFLRAQQADSALERVPGSRHEALEIWRGINAFVWAVGAYLVLMVRGRARRLSLTDWWNPAKQSQPIQPLGDRTRTFAMIASLVLLGCGIGFLVATVQANVWEGESIWTHFADIYLPVYSGLCMLGMVIRDYRLVHYGLPSSSIGQLTEEQIEPIRRALEDRKFSVAVKRYREAMPSAGLAEARQYVIQLFGTLRAQHPERFAPPPLSLATLNWKALGIGALFEAAFFGTWWVALPPTYPTLTAAVFTGCLCAGAGFIWGLRMTGFRKVLVLIGAFVVMILSMTIVPHQFEGSLSAGPFVGGMISGMVLMLCAIHPRNT